MIVREKISVVIPVYNNASILKQSYAKLQKYLQAQMPDYEIIYVNDASIDNSIDILKAIAHSDARVQLIDLKNNRGQQRALSIGLEASSGDIVFTIDADLPTELDDFELMIAKLRAGYDLVLGKRIGKRKTQPYRMIGATLSNFLIRVLFRFRLGDFGCSTGAASKKLVQRFRQSTVSRSVIKLAMLSLSEKYCEVELRTSSLLQNKSTYTFWGLVRLLFSVIRFR